MIIVLGQTLWLLGAFCMHSQNSHAAAAPINDGTIAHCSVCNGNACQWALCIVKRQVKGLGYVLYTLEHYSSAGLF